MIRLNCHTIYSVGDALSTPEELSELGGVVAITDHGNISGAIKFQEKCKGKNTKPIFGMDMYHEHDSRIYHITILCESLEGYYNLLELSAISHRNKVNNFPCINYETLRGINSGLIAICGGVSSAIGYSIYKGDKKSAWLHCKEMYEIFKDRFYLSVSKLSLREIDTINKAILSISKKYGIKYIVTNEPHYTNENDALAHAVLVADNLKKQLDPDWALYHGIRNAHASAHVETTSGMREISERCNVEIPTGSVHLPKFQIPESFETEEDYLWYIISKGLRDRGINFSNKEYMDRIHYEYSVVCNMGFSGYFLIVHDFVKYAHDNNIPVGPGRGSGAGSLMAYLLKITDIDPIKYDLLFERFLNPDRVSMPDFDIDFCKDKRDLVIDYMRSKYGEECVGYIGTFTRMKAKGSWRSAARAFGLSPFEQDQFSKIIPDEMSLKESLSVDSVRDFIRENEGISDAIDIAIKLEGSIRSLSKHAAGIVVADAPLYKYIPVFYEDDTAVSQFDMKDVEKSGLLKFDFLGLKTLTVIERCISMIDDFEEDFSLEDKATFKMLSEGKTLGVFQLESKGMRRLMTELKPSCLEDIIAAVALYRPGPMGSGMLSDFVDIRHGKKKPKYLHPKLKEILEPTYGVIVYQEQVMKIAQVMANYTLGEADLLRRAMGKKKPEEMESQKKKFIEGCLENNWWGEETESESENLFELINYFSGYGFNRSHSAAYGMISYKTAYLKANYPSEFIAAQIFCRKEDIEDVSAYVHEARYEGMDIVYPDVNISPNDTVSIDGKIFLGINTIKGVSKRTCQLIEKLAPYKDVIQMISSTKANKKDIVALCKAGALDSINDGNRASLSDRVDDILKVVRRKTKKSIEDAFLNKSAIKVGRDSSWSKRKTLDEEISVLGYYRSGHPIDNYIDELSLYGVINVSDWKEDGLYEYIVCGVVHEIKVHVIYKEDGSESRMAWVTVGDHTGKMEVTIFPRQFSRSEYLLRSGQLLLFELKKNLYKGSVTAVCNDCVLLSEYRMRHTSAFYTSEEDIHIESSDRGVPLYKTNGDIQRVSLRKGALDDIFNSK